MRPQKQKMIHNLPRWAAPTAGSRRRFGILCLQLCLFWAATAMLSPAQDQKPATDSATFTTLVNFDGTDGANPIAPPVQGLDGNLYGVAWNGGSGCPTYDGCGTFFKLTPGGALTTVYSFCPEGWPCAGEGADSPGPLTLGTDGNFYGITNFGGTGAYGSALNNGTVFRITPGGVLTTLYNWCSQPNCADGLPNAPSGLIQGTDGNFYGATWGGGANCVSNGGCGTVFKLTPSGALTTLYSFCAQSNCADGDYPQGIVEGSDGDFYGTTAEGGDPGEGTVFKITPSGTFTTLYSFCSLAGCTDGAKPPAPLIQGVDGNFYGTTTYGGNAVGCHTFDGLPYPCGTLFQITPEGTLTTIYNFCSAVGDCPDGSPFGGLVQATDGNFYGETSSGGADGDGTIFRITPQGELTTLYSFDFQFAAIGFGMVQATNGDFYGTTSLGPILPGNGTIYSLSVGLGPFVETLPTSGKVGAQIKILGTELTDATSVSFNGVEAPFEVISRSLISATVPEGATTGFVTVSSGYATLKSNVRFQVRP
jgi:uncharacterized repeat protein (TIGR03803 family)